MAEESDGPSPQDDAKREMDLESAADEVARIPSGSSPDDLFCQHHSSESAAEKASAPAHAGAYERYRCGARFEASDDTRFCSKCGAPVNLRRSPASHRVLLIDDSQLSRKKIGGAEWKHIKFPQLFD